MNFSDLLVVVALGSGLYAVVVALTGQRQFLLKAVNPHRLTWLLAAVSVLWVGLSLMRWEAGSWDLRTWGGLFAQLISDAPTPPRVKVASVAIFFGASLAGLVLWCTVVHPRDPTAFRRPEHRAAAFRYYVVRLGGGLDYAMLALGDGQRLEEGFNRTQVARWCSHLPKVAPEGQPPRVRTPEDQLEVWRQLAARLHERMKELDALIEPARQGYHRGLIFDAEYGGMFFRYLRSPDPRDPVSSGLYLFAATLNQEEMNSGRAERHFQLLLEAVKHIDRSVRVA